MGPVSIPANSYSLEVNIFTSSSFYQVHNLDLTLMTSSFEKIPMAHILHHPTTSVKCLKTLWYVLDCSNLHSVQKQLLVFLVPILLKQAQHALDIFTLWRQHFVIYCFLLGNFQIGPP